jgi:hypothetical protein
MMTGSCAVTFDFGSADNATKPAAEVTDSLMNFLLLSFFMVPRVRLSISYPQITQITLIFFLSLPKFVSWLKNNLCNLCSLWIKSVLIWLSLLAPST